MTFGDSGLYTVQQYFKKTGGEHDSRLELQYFVGLLDHSGALDQARDGFEPGLGSCFR
jgi:hypothetical protein